MIYELRTYWAAPGKLDALLHRFDSLTMALFEQHQMTVVGFWTPETPTEQTGDLVYLMAFPDETALEKAWAAFRSDPNWVSGKAASEVDGSLTRRVLSTRLQATSFSPLQ